MAATIDLQTYWQGNAVLQTAIPFENVFVNQVPKTTAYPYCSVTTLGTTYSLLTTGRVEYFDFQISVFDTSLESTETLLDTIEGQFINATPTPSTTYLKPTTRMPAEVEADQPNARVQVYHGWCEYRWATTK